jgi:RNA polymerase sigma factor (sigma-70 family)
MLSNLVNVPEIAKLLRKRREQVPCNVFLTLQYSPVMRTYRTDEDLMIAVRDGDVDQLEVLFERYREPLYDFFGRLTGNRSVSEDLVQDVFVRILKYRTTYREANRFVTWMYQIARNSRIDYLKKHRTETVDTTPDIVAFTRTPGRQLEESEEKALLQRAMMQLTESNRELLILLRYQEMKYEDIAELLGTEVGAVRTRVHRAMKELRDTFMKLRSNESSCNATKSGTTFPTT